MTGKVVNYVQKYRLEKDITQIDLAKNLGVTRQTIIAIEKGNYTPSVSLALKIAQYFQQPVEKLFKIE